jgi:DNA-binding SARP family transcriptional activator
MTHLLRRAEDESAHTVEVPVQSAHIGVSETPIIPIQEHLAAGPRPRGVRVHSIGPLLVTLGRLPIHSLGGPKAGAKQALGLFAFLFDRGPQGVEKDEAVEVIWPDSSITVADTAFHRTLLGLRGSLGAGGFGDAVEFRNGRYVLASGLVSWSDTSELERMIDASASTSDLRARIELLESSRQLNRADYMDDCPFFGTSVFVEARRAMLRAVRQAVLVELGELYDSLGHHALATIRAAEADAVSGLTESAS